MPARFIFLLVFLLLFMVVPSAVDLLTEWFWFGEVAYTDIFIRTLTAKATVGGLVFLVAFGVLVTKPYLLFPGGGDIQPITLERTQLKMLGTGVAALAALFLGLFASNEWLTWLRFQHATPFGQIDPLFGRDVGFYVFTLPFLDFARYLMLAVAVLSLIGSTAAYVISGTLALDPARGPVVGDGARRHLGLVIAVLFLLLAWGAYLDVPRRPASSTARRTSTWPCAYPCCGDWSSSRWSARY